MFVRLMCACALLLFFAPAAWAEVRAETGYLTLSYSVPMPLPSDKLVMLEAEGDAAKAAGDFVDPRDTGWFREEGATETGLIVRFRFKGPKDTTRRIRLTAQFLDAQGAVIHEESRDCEDARSARAKCKCIDDPYRNAYRMNRELFAVDPAAVAGAHTLRIRFEEI